MNQSIEEKLARSLTADDTSIIPYLPYLLQDLWELGSSADDIFYLLEKNHLTSQLNKVLDLGCGKGAVAIPLAEKLDCCVKGIDLIPDFIKEAEEIAQARQLSANCEFIEGDINQAVRVERNYDCVIFGAVGDVMGDYSATLEKLKSTVAAGGLIFWDDAFVATEAGNHNLRMAYEYLTQAQWQALFQQNHVQVIDSLVYESYEEADYLEDYHRIAKRADELSTRFPNKKAMFEQYKRNQLAEYQDLEDNCKGILWLLKT